MKKILSIGLALLCLSIVALGADTVVTSPNGQIKVTINTADGLSWTVSRNGKTVYIENGIALIIGGKTLGDKAKVKSIKQKPGNQIMHPIVPLKFSEIRDNYNEATINYGAYQVLLRVMDNAVAHRFVLNQKGNVEIMDERFNLCPANDFTAHYQTAGSFNTSY